MKRRAPQRPNPVESGSRRAFVGLFVLCMVTGMVDAVSFVGFDRVFTANMTGNIVMTGFAVAGWNQVPLVNSLAALAAFVAGTFVTGLLARRGARVAHLLCGQIALVSSAGVASLLLPAPRGMIEDCTILVLLAAGMGVQTIAIRELKVPDLTTTVLTLTIAGISADSRLAGGTSPRVARRVTAVALMFLGSVTGAALCLRVSTDVALWATVPLIATATILLWQTTAPATNDNADRAP